MNSGVKNYIQKCNVCTAMGTGQRREPLQKHEVSDRPQANGKVEHSVKTAKALLKKAKEGHPDPYLSLLAFRNTPTPGFLLVKVPPGVKEQQAYHYNHPVKEMASLIETRPGDCSSNNSATLLPQTPAPR